MRTTGRRRASATSPSETAGKPAVDKRALRAAVMARSDALFEAFGLELHEEPGGELVGPCPVHGGDGRTNFRLYPSGFWRCFSHGCHDTFGGDVLGLIWGLLVARDGADPGFPGALRWCRETLGRLPTAAESAVEVGRFLATAERLVAGPKPQPRLFPAAEVAARLDTPSEYFVGRGYPPDLLSAFLVGEPKEDRPGPLRGRAIVPLMDLAGGSVVGFSGRYRGVPSEGTPKWLHQPKGLLRGELLYGWDTAEAAVRESGVCVLVEGCPDVWAWRARGFRNVVGLLGVSLSDPQQAVLERSGAVELVLAQDADAAGDEGAARALDKVAPIFLARRAKPPAGKKDWGDAFEGGLPWHL